MGTGTDAARSTDRESSTHLRAVPPAGLIERHLQLASLARLWGGAARARPTGGRPRRGRSWLRPTGRSIAGWCSRSIATAYQRNPDNWLRVGLNPHEIATVRASAHTRFTLIRCYLDFADAEFTRDDGESVARARSLYQAALTLPEMAAPGTGSGANPFPANPVPAALELRAELNLFKLRSGRSIAGIERQATSIGPSQAVDRLPSADAAPQPSGPRPTATPR